VGCRIIVSVTPSSYSLPYDFTLKMFVAKNLIEETTHEMINVRPNVKIDTTRIRK